MDLSERSRKVLQAVIDSYIETGLPVGSAVLVKKYEFNLSSATLRNIMAELEELGYLTHPHTSAGRMPTDRGYRYYIDTIISFEREQPSFSGELAQAEALQSGEIHQLMEEASQFLARLSHHAGVVVAPAEPEGLYRHIEFVRLRGNEVLIIFVTNTGAVMNKIVDMDEAISQHDLNAFSGYLDEELEYRTLPEVRQRLLELLREEKAGFLKLFERAYRASQEIRERESEKVFIGGASQIIDSPEFTDIEKIRALFRAFEDKYKLIKLLDKSVAAQGIKVFIGSENPYFEMQDCSLVVGSYKAGSAIGTLGVIGPVRMHYKQVIQVVDYTSRLLSRILDERLKKGIDR
ncbi:MAG: heat-inducible transcriptional repressor HrcA [Nitrospiraceae bacterium]|nr:heat-inducible transcriptional repressor HrcA [Nitrospiraceae bacterium]